MTTPAQPTQTQPVPVQTDQQTNGPTSNGLTVQPNMDALLQPGPAAASGTSTAPLTQGQQVVQQAQPYFDRAAQADQRAEQIANTPVTVPVGPHAKLLGMIQGLALGMGAFGTAIATHGKEGGVQEVQAVQQSQQEMRIQQQQAAEAKKNTQLQQQLTVGDTNRQIGQNIYLLHTMGTAIDKSNLEMQSSQLGIQTQIADFMKQNWGLTPAQVSGTAAAGPADLSQSKSMLSRSVAGASQILGANDPSVVAANTVIDNPNPSVKDIMNAGQGLNFALNQNKEVTESQNLAAAGLPKTQSEAAAQLAAAQSSGDPARIAKAQSVKDSIDRTVQQERQFASNLQAQNNAANKAITMSNTLAQKGIEDTNKLWTDPQHGFAQTAAQVSVVKNAAAQAKNGSELAASLEPAMTVLGVNSFAGVHRISPTEYEAAGPQVGSLYRRLNALLDKAGSGSVPQATLSEVNGIMDALVQAKYKSSVDSTRQIVANAGVPSNRIFIPDPNNYGVLTTLDKVSGGTQQPQIPAGNVQVQIPGQPTGYIPRNRLDAFRAKHPNAIVIGQ